MEISLIDSGRPFYLTQAKLAFHEGLLVMAGDGKGICQNSSCVRDNSHIRIIFTYQTSCAGGRHNMPHPCDLDLWPFDLQSGVRVTCDVGYLCGNFSLPKPLCSRLRPDVCNRQTDVRQTDSQMSDSIIA